MSKVIDIKRETQVAIENEDLSGVITGLQHGACLNVVDHLDLLKHAIVYANREAFNVIANHPRSDNKNIFLERDDFKDNLLHWMAKHPLREIPFIEAVAAYMPSLDILDGSGKTALELFSLNSITIGLSDLDLAAANLTKTGTEILVGLGAKPTAQQLKNIYHHMNEKSSPSNRPFSPNTRVTLQRMITCLENALDPFEAQELKECPYQKAGQFMS